MIAFVWDFDWYERDLAETIKAAFPQTRVMKQTGQTLLGFPVVVDPAMPSNRVDVIDAEGETIARIENLAAASQAEQEGR